MGPGNRPLDMDWLEDFLALVETANFSRAAEARAIAQPALSRHIRSLEEWVGVELIDRSAHAAGLTPAGKRFHPLLVEVLAGLEAARIKARAAHDEAAATLSFASTHVLSLYFFPRWLAQLEERLQLGPVQTMSDSSTGCEEMLLQRRVQFVLCYGAQGSLGRLDEGKYPVLHLGDEVLVPVSVPGPDGQALHAVGSGDVLPVLGYSEASGAGRIMRSHLGSIFGPMGGEQAAQRVSVVFSAHSAILLKTMALSGRGVAWLPLTLVTDDLAAGRLVDAGQGQWRVPLEIRLYRQRAELAPTAERLWQVVVASPPAV
jgi:DNA-binding transcriptional LysR family regulator